MKKKKHTHHHFRHRNAVVTRSPRTKPGEETPMNRLGYTAAGAAGSAVLGAFLARQGWAPKTIASALTAVGAGLAGWGDGSTIRSVGAGTMSAAGSQLALMVIDDRDKKVAAPALKAKNAESLPPGALEAAFDRARERLALSSGGYQA